MKPSRPLLSRTGEASRTPYYSGFSLVEILVVTSLVGLMLAMTIPGLVTLSPARKTAIHEVAGFLENARSRAMAAQSEMLVAFANGSVPAEYGPYRSYALFALDGSITDGLEGKSLRQLTPWRSLPKGIVFAHGEHFEVKPGVAFRTIFETVERRSFPLPSVASGGTGTRMVELPFILFGPDGGVRAPAFSEADALHVGIAEGFFVPESGHIQLTSKRTGENGTREFANGECLEIGYYTGRPRILTD